MTGQLTFVPKRPTEGGGLARVGCEGFWLWGSTDVLPPAFAFVGVVGLDGGVGGRDEGDERCGVLAFASNASSSATRARTLLASSRAASLSCST